MLTYKERKAIEWESKLNIIETKLVDCNRRRKAAILRASRLVQVEPHLQLVGRAVRT